MTLRPIFINGRFLGKKITGTERFAREIVSAFDALLTERKLAYEVTLLAPQGTASPEGLSCINFKTVGKLKGHAWEQWDLFWASRKGILLNFCNSGSVLHPRQLVVIHDAAVYRMPDNYSLSYGTFHRTLGKVLSRRSQLATVSEFSRSELTEIFGKHAASMPILPNGYEHILRHKPEPEILDRLALRDRPFFLFVGSPVPNKNLARAIEGFSRLGREDVAFVIVGAAQAKVFGTAQLQKPDNVIMPGRLSDGEIVALYQNATALVFPSLYEGFGIPPLEAMALNCPVVASRIAPVEEVCGDAALYFDALNPEDIAQAMKESLDDNVWRSATRTKGQNRLPHYSWKSGAVKLVNCLNTNF